MLFLLDSPGFKQPGFSAPGIHLAVLWPHSVFLDNRQAIVKFLTTPNRAVCVGQINTELGMVTRHTKACGCVFVFVHNHHFSPVKSAENRI